jgi:REP element-mobilizing transposase RayT
MTRHWLITSTTYGTWLPGDRRGFVSTVANPPGPRVRHNQPGTPYDANMPELRESARSLLQGKPVYLSVEQAEVVLLQFQETVAWRGWELHAVAVMANHFHVVISAPDEIHSTAILRDLKSYAARALNQRWGKPVGGTWWTESGSRRPLANGQALEDAGNYVLYRQPKPLILWPAQGAQRLRGLTPPAQGVDVG